jgi:hypothetical protein
MVHVEGTRARSCREPVTRVSSVFTDLAVELNMPVIPVRFVGGLPVDPVPERLEFPFEGGQQDIVIGRPITPAELRELPLRERSRVVIEAIEGLRPQDEQPLPSRGPLPQGAKAVLRQLLPPAETDSVNPWLDEFNAWLRAD